MLRRLCTLLVIALLALGQPLHAATSDCCAGDHAASVMQADGAPSKVAGHCGGDHAAVDCGLLCHSAAVLASPIPCSSSQRHDDVAFAGLRRAATPSREIPPEPFPPRTSVLS